MLFISNMVCAPTVKSCPRLTVTGTMVRISPNEVAVADLDASRVIHGLKEGFPKGDWYVKLAPKLTEDMIGVFAMIDPKVHGVRRRLFAQGFSKSSILRWEETIKTKVLTAVTKIERDALAGSADILKWWTLMANDVICEVAFGEDFDAMGGEQVSSSLRTHCGTPILD